MSAPAGPPGSTDTELVARVLAADREAFAAVYDRYGPRLYDFAHSMLRHREDAADAVADSFVLFAERLHQLRDPERLRPWLYAIVRSECLGRLKARSRIALGDEEHLGEMADQASGPHEEVERAALRQLVWDASAGLGDRDRALLDLHLRQGLEGAELGEAIGVSANNAYVMLNRLRAQVDRSLGALLVARLGRDDCEDLDRLLVDWDGGFSPLVRKRVARHVDGCDVCGERRRRAVSPWMLLAGVPMVAAPAGLRDRVLGETRLVAHAGAPYEEVSAGTVGGRRWAPARTTLTAAAVLVVLVLATVLFRSTADDAPAALDAADTSSPTVGPTTTAGTADDTPTPTAPATAAASPPSPSATTSTPSPSAVAGTLIASTSTIKLGRTATQGAFRLTNVGDLPVAYQVSPRAPWLTVPAIGGSLTGGTSSVIRLQVDRATVAEGVSTGRVVITWDGGSLVVGVSLDEERGPVVSRPLTAPNPSCDVDVTADVTDDSPVASALLVWDGPDGSGGSAMTHAAGSTWTARLHVTVGGTLTMHVVATDARDNTTSGPPSSIEVNPCPQ